MILILIPKVPKNRANYILMFFILLFLSKCRQEYNMNMNVEQDPTVKCIEDNFSTNSDIFSCIKVNNFDLYGYQLIDSVFYRSNFKGERIRVDSVPATVVKGYNTRQKACNPTCSGLTLDAKVIDENGFWVSE